MYGPIPLSEESRNIQNHFLFIFKGQIKYLTEKYVWGGVLINFDCDIWTLTIPFCQK
jgi:hypothetical protein